MKKIGIFGGTFNPVHVVHLKMAEKAYRRLNLDKIIFVPSYNPYHKEKKESVDFNHRFNMLKLAIKDSDYFEVSDIEKRMNKEKSFTVDLLLEIKNNYKDDEIYFILGADSLINIKKWNNFQRIFDLTKIIVFFRKNYDNGKIYSLKDEFQKEYGATIYILEDLNSDISSTAIRHMIKDGRYENISDDVKNYIIRNNLYEK